MCCAYSYAHMHVVSRQFFQTCEGRPDADGTGQDARHASIRLWRRARLTADRDLPAAGGSHLGWRAANPHGRKYAPPASTERASSERDRGPTAWRYLAREPQVDIAKLPSRGLQPYPLPNAAQAYASIDRTVCLLSRRLRVLSSCQIIHTVRLY